MSDDDVIDAICAWYQRYGACPTTQDWDPSRARRNGQEWRAERFEAGTWPTVRIVVRRFGTFNAAIRAAGFEPRPAPHRQRANLAGPDEILRAFLEWTRRYGDVPMMADWDPTRARRLGQDWRIARYYQDDWPSARSVANHFGSFTSAAVAAGLTPRTRGKHHDPRLAESQRNRRVAATATTGTPGPAPLSQSVRAVAAAKREQDPVMVRRALLELAGQALAWADSLVGVEPSADAD